jgi:DNA-binding transcriptional ArsR family regulator
MYEGLSKLLKAMANPLRLEIIEMLSQGEKSVEGIVQATSLSFANASQHLLVLKNNNTIKPDGLSSKSIRIRIGS